MLGGKCGLVHVHTGAGPRGLQPLRDALAVSDLPISAFLPTHVECKPRLVEEGAAWLRDGGSVDLTAGEEVRIVCLRDSPLVINFGATQDYNDTLIMSASS